MSIFSRFTDIVNANLNSMLDKAENPEKMLRLIIQEMEETLVEVRSTAAKSIAEKKTLMRQIRQLEKSMTNWQEKATLAITKNREDLARSALAEKQKCQQSLTALQEELDEIDQHLTLVQEDGQRLQDKLTEAKRKQDAFALRQQSVEVRLKVKQQSHVQQMDCAIAKFERYQQKIDRLEAELESYELTENKDLNSQFRDLENESSVDDELAELKKQVANG